MSLDRWVICASSCSASQGHHHADELAGRGGEVDVRLDADHGLAAFPGPVQQVRPVPNRPREPVKLGRNDAVVGLDQVRITEPRSELGALEGIGLAGHVRVRRGRDDLVAVCLGPALRLGVLFVERTAVIVDSGKPRYLQKSDLSLYSLLPA